MTETASENVSLLSKFMREVSYTGAGTGFTMLFGMVNMMILARYLPRYEYGIFLLLMVLTNFLSMISAFGLNTSVILSIASAAGEDRSRIVNSVVIFRFLTFGLVSVIFFLGQRWFLLLFGESDIGGLAIFVPFMLATQGYRMLLRAILQGFFRFKRIATIDLITSAFNLAMIIAFVLVLKASFTGLVLAQIISQGFACLMLYWAIPVPKRLQLHLDHLLRAIRLGLPLQVNDIMSFIFGNVGTLIVAALLGPDDVALLSVAGKLPGMMRRFYDAFRNVYLPNLTKLLAEGDQRRAHELLNTTIRLVSFVTALAALIAALFANELILLLFSEKYLPAVTVFVLTMAWNTALAVNVLGTTLVGAGYSKGATISNVLASVVILLANLVLIPLLGINGVPLARMPGILVAALSNIWFLRRRQIFVNMAGLLKPLLIFVGFCVPVLYFESIPWLYRGLLLILFPIVCYLFSVITREDLSRSLSFVRHYLIGKTRAKAAILSK